MLYTLTIMTIINSTLVYNLVLLDLFINFTILPLQYSYMELP